MKRTTVVLSFDGLGTQDLEILRTLPNFSRYLTEAAYVDRVKTVYPSQTYAAHASISTGKLPCHHGIINNTKLQPGHLTAPDWYWYRKEMQGKTFYEVAKEQGMITAAFLWPVSGGADIDYHVPEIFQNRLWKNQIYMSLHNGSKQLQMDLLARYGRWLLHGTGQPYLDTFVHKSALYTMKKYHPDLTLVHYCDLDHLRHRHGHDGPEAEGALHRHDQRLGDWMKLLEDRDSNLIVLGDHSSLDVHSGICLNHYLQKKGFIHATAGKIYSYEVIAKAAGGSCYLYLDKKAERFREELTYLLKGLMEDFSRQHGDCLAEILTPAEAEKKGADPHCLLMLEAKEGYYFLDTLKGPEVYGPKADKLARELGLPRLRLDGATHGYSPEKPGYTTFFGIRTASGTATGTGQKKEILFEETISEEAVSDKTIRELPTEDLPVVIPGRKMVSMSLIDEGPTIAYLLGGELPEADGRVVTELFQ